MKLEITDEELNTIFKEKVIQHFKETVADPQLGYWVRSEVQKLLADKIVSIMGEHFSDENIKLLLKTAIKDHVDERYS